MNDNFFFCPDLVLLIINHEKAVSLPNYRKGNQPSTKCREIKKLIAQCSNRQTERNLNQVINSLREADWFCLKSRKLNDLP